MQEQDEGDSSTVHYHFVQQALQPLVEMLLKLLSKQEEGQDEDDGIWNLSLAGGNCLSLVAAVVGDEVLALVMPYIQVCPPHLRWDILEKASRHVSALQGVVAALWMNPLVSTWPLLLGSHLTAPPLSCKI